MTNCRCCYAWPWSFDLWGFVVKSVLQLREHNDMPFFHRLSHINHSSTCSFRYLPRWNMLFLADDVCNHLFRAYFLTIDWVKILVCSDIDWPEALLLLWRSSRTLIYISCNLHCQDWWQFFSVSFFLDDFAAWNWLPQIGFDLSGSLTIIEGVWQIVTVIFIKGQPTNRSCSLMDLLLWSLTESWTISPELTCYITWLNCIWLICLRSFWFSAVAWVEDYLLILFLVNEQVAEISTSDQIIVQWLVSKWWEGMNRCFNHRFIMLKRNSQRPIDMRLLLCTFESSVCR